jgi:hypothetical protein
MDDATVNLDEVAFLDDAVFGGEAVNDFLVEGNA